METVTMYMIWSVEHSGWLSPRRSYTNVIQDAEKYEIDEAVAICKAANINESNVPNQVLVPIDVCAYCLGTGEVEKMVPVYPGEPHMAGIDTEPCVCKSTHEE